MFTLHTPCVSALTADELRPELSRVAGDVLERDWAIGMRSFQQMPMQCYSLQPSKLGECAYLNFDTAMCCSGSPRQRYTKANLGRALHVHLSFSPCQLSLLETFVKDVGACTPALLMRALLITRNDLMLFVLLLHSTR